MSAEILFFHEISKLKRRIIIRTLHQVLLSACLIFLCFCLVVFIIQKVGFSNSDELVLLYILSIGFSLVAALMRGFLKRKEFINILIDIDRRLRLHDRVSTAYEFSKIGGKNAFSELQMKDAAAKLSQFNSKQLLPTKFFKMHLLFIFLVGINLALILSDDLSPDFKSISGGQNKLEAVNELLRNYSISHPERKNEKNRLRQNVYSKKLENLRNKLNDRSITETQLSTALHQILGDLQAEQTRLAIELDARLNAVKVGEMSKRTIPSLEDFSGDKLEKLKMLLNWSLNNQIPDAINKNIETLQELYSMEKLISQIINGSIAGNFRSEELAKSEWNEIRGSKYRNDHEKLPKDAKRSKTNGEYSGGKHSIGETNGDAGFDQLQENGRDLQDDLGLGEEYSSSAGRAKSTGRKKSSYEIEKLSGNGTREKTIASPLENYLIRIRSLTAIGEAELKGENIIRSYRKDIEGVLQKEDIPLNYREYIKHYFISIGLKSEKKANELQ